LREGRLGVNIRAKKDSTDTLFLGLSILLQILLGIFFGHAYDQRIYMATGYLVGTGQNPYIAQDLQAVFHNSGFQGMTSVGYPPPWPLVMGLIYLFSYRLFPNILIYNLALKLPIIAANISLAFLVKRILERLRVTQAVSRNAWLFMLFNPFLLLVTVAWGQFDSLVALLSLLALVFLVDGKSFLSALLLALAISFKPTALPLLPAVGLFLWNRPFRRITSYFSINILFLILFCAGPFLIFHWDPSVIFSHWNAQFSVGGGLSFMTFLELVANSYQLPAWLAALGFLCFPAVALATFLLKPGADGLQNLLKKATLLVLVFFLFRTWVSETNLILVMPMLVILVSTGELDARLRVAWILPLLFSLFNTSITQLLFPSLPVLMGHLLHESLPFRIIRLTLRTAVVIPFLLLEGTIILALWRQVRSEKLHIFENKLKSEN
jgi:hypothetical protein